MTAILMITVVKYFACFMSHVLRLQLEELRAQNVAALKDLWERVRTLWDRVELTKEERDVFQSQNIGVSQRVIQSVSITVKTY